MRTVNIVSVCATIAVPLSLLCACGGAGQQTATGADIPALCERFRANAPNDRTETVDQIVAHLQAETKGAQSASLTTQKIKDLLGKPDKEVETIQTDGNIVVWRYQLEVKPKSGQYVKIDALVLRFKSDALVSVAKQQGWVPKGG